MSSQRPQEASAGSLQEQYYDGLATESEQDLRARRKHRQTGDEHREQRREQVGFIDGVLELFNRPLQCVMPDPNVTAYTNLLTALFSVVHLSV